MIKKLIGITVSAMMMFAMSVSAFAAGSIDENEQAVLDALSENKVPAEYVTQAKNYFEKDNVVVTAEQAKVIISNIDEAATIAKTAGIKTKDDLAKADTDIINSIVAKAQTAAKELELTVTYDTKSGVATIKDYAGNVVATSSVGIKKTGADTVATTVIISGLGMIVVGLGIASKKNEKAIAE